MSAGQASSPGLAEVACQRVEELVLALDEHGAHLAELVAPPLERAGAPGRERGPQALDERGGVEVGGRGSSRCGQRGGHVGSLPVRAGRTSSARRGRGPRAGRGRSRPRRRRGRAERCCRASDRRAGDTRAVIPSWRGPTTSGPQVSPTNSTTSAPTPTLSSVCSKIRGWGLRAPAHADDTTTSTASGKPDLVDRFREVPVPVRADGEQHAPAPQLGEHLQRPRRRARARGPGCPLELLHHHLVLTGVQVGLGEDREQAVALPVDVVVAAVRVLEVLDAVDPVVPPAVAHLGGELDSVLGQHHVDRDPSGGLGEGAVEIEEDGLDTTHGGAPVR